MATFLVNLSPADMSNLRQLQPVRFSVSTEGAAQDWVAVWFQEEGSDAKVLVYESCGGFSPPFADNSTVEDPEGDLTTLTFSVVPELGWPDNVAELRIVGEPTISTDPFP